jgi:glycosyltransferase involved in cell wall biosynthesis
MARYERHLIAHAALGMFNGMDCYVEYSKYCRNSHLVHNFTRGPSDRIGNQELERRLQRRDQPLRLVYAGRVHREKGVFDWIDALNTAAEDGSDFLATWYGAGPELDAARIHVMQLGLTSKISFPGTLDDHGVLSALRNADAFVFCHKTPESPRCLVEALISGLPLIGYESPYSKDLIRNGGGLLTAQHDPRGIARSIAILEDRAKLIDLTHRAQLDGALCSYVDPFRQRSDLMKTISCHSRRRDALLC